MSKIKWCYSVKGLIHYLFQVHIFLGRNTYSTCCSFVYKQVIILCGNRSGLYLKGNHLIFQYLFIFFFFYHTCLQTHSHCVQYRQHIMRTILNTRYILYIGRKVWPKLLFWVGGMRLHFLHQFLVLFFILLPEGQRSLGRCVWGVWSKISCTAVSMEQHQSGVTAWKGYIAHSLSLPRLVQPAKLF